MDSIVTYLLIQNQYLISIISQLLVFIAKYIPLKQWIFDDSNSPKYNKFKLDKLPIIIHFEKVDYELLLAYYKHKYGKTLKSISRRNGRTIPEHISCPRCGAPHHYIYDNNGGKGQYQCKVCGQNFWENHHADKPITYRCPYCGHSLTMVKERSQFRIHKCVNKHCDYYTSNKKSLPKDIPPHEKSKYKLHYIYREFTINFFKMDLHALPQRATNFNYKKFNAHVMGLCLTYHVNLQLSTRQTARALKEVHGIDISHTTISNYALTAASVIKPFVDHFDYQPSNNLAADETYIKVKGIRHYIWFIMDATKKSILGYQVSDTRSVGPCILAMRMAFDKFKTFPGKALNFIADGYSAYPLAKQQFELEEDKIFDLTQVIGLLNNDPVSTEYRWFKQVVERLNRTFKASYRTTCGYGSQDGAAYSVALWVAYYNFLRPHKANNYKVLNEVELLSQAENMPGKWQLLLYLGQQTIKQQQLGQRT